MNIILEVQNNFTNEYNIGEVKNNVLNFKVLNKVIDNEQLTEKEKIDIFYILKKYSTTNFSDIIKVMNNIIEGVEIDVTEEDIDDYKNKNKINDKLTSNEIIEKDKKKKIKLKN